MPELLVLDTEHWYRRLTLLAARYAQEYDSCNCDHFVMDLTAEVIELIRDRRSAETQLRSFCGEIQAGVAHAGADVIPPMFAPVALEFGKDLIRQLDEARAYLPNGVLPYSFHLLPRLQDNTTLYLHRTGELPR